LFKLALLTVSVHQPKAAKTHWGGIRCEIYCSQCATMWDLLEPVCHERQASSLWIWGDPVTYIRHSGKGRGTEVWSERVLCENGDRCSASGCFSNFYLRGEKNGWGLKLSQGMSLSPSK
jgi:hypothetical protein